MGPTHFKDGLAYHVTDEMSKAVSSSFWYHFYNLVPFASNAFKTISM